jgi:hypothetical protein
MKIRNPPSFPPSPRSIHPLEKGGWGDLKDILYVIQYIINSYLCIGLNGEIGREKADILSMNHRDESGVTQ